MGQDFIEKTNDRFRRCREKVYEDNFRSRDLFSEVLPIGRADIFGLISCSDLEVGDELWHHEPANGSNGDDLELRKGNMVALRMENGSEPKAAIEDLERERGAELTYLVVEIEPTLNMARVEPLKPNRG